MSDIRLNDDGDIYLNEGSSELTTGQDSILQSLSQRINTFLGEWFLDTDLGVPWFEQILVKGPEPAILDAVLKRVILETPGILQLKTFDIQIDSALRKMKLVFDARTVDGDVNYSEVVP